MIIVLREATREAQRVERSCIAGHFERNGDGFLRRWISRKCGRPAAGDSTEEALLFGRRAGPSPMVDWNAAGPDDGERIRDKNQRLSRPRGVRREARRV